MTGLSAREHQQIKQATGRARNEWHKARRAATMEEVTMTTETTRPSKAADWPGRALRRGEERVTGVVTHANEAGIRLRGGSAWLNFGALKVGPLRPETVAPGDAVELVGHGRWINAIRLVGDGPAPPAADAPDDDGLWAALEADGLGGGGGRHG